MRRKRSFKEIIDRPVQSRLRHLGCKLRVRAMRGMLALVTLSLLFNPAIGWTAKGDGGSAGSRVIELQKSQVKVRLMENNAYQISLGGQHFSRELPQRHRIRLHSQSFDPKDDAAASQPTVLATQPDEDDGVYIVQFITQALEPFQHQIRELGGIIYSPLPDHALIVRMDSAARQAVEQLEFVRWVGVYHAAYKLEDDLVRMVEAEDSGLIQKAYERQRYSIMLFEKGESAQDIVADRILQLGGKVDLLTQGRRMEASLSSDELQEIAQMNEVLYIDRWTPAEDDMDLVRSSNGANYIETVEGYTGQGVRGEVVDHGIRASHVDFQNNKPLMHTGNTSDTSHGTCNYGIVFGDGTGNGRARGMLPDAELPIFNSRDKWSKGRYVLMAELVDPVGPYRAVFQTNSWGHSQTTKYTTVSAEMDDELFELDLVVTQSQSNEGNRNSRPEAWAKNIVAVGGIQGFDTAKRSDDRWGGRASIGPAKDGRIKPDLSQFYGDMYTTSDTGNKAYRDFGGTSGATPAAAGHFGLMFQMWADGVFSGGPGQGRDVFDSRPHMTTAKALMIHSAYQYNFSGKSHDRTRVHQGWGFPDVNNLYEYAKANNWSLPILVDETEILKPLQVHAYDLSVDGNAPLKATLVYADPAGLPSAAQQRINDLTLKVTSPDGTVYWGNNGLLEGNWSTPGGSPNTIDTVENVFVKAAEAGVWTIEVLGDEIIKDSHKETPDLDADYALVVTGGIESDPVNRPPAAPKNPVAKASQNRIDLDWSENSEPDLEAYLVHRGTDSGGPYNQIASLSLSAYADNDVVNGMTYYYVVTAVDQEGLESDFSVEVSATPGEQPIETIANDGFESKNFSGGDGWLAKWIKKGNVILAKNNPYEGNRYAYLTGGKNPGYLKRTVDLSNVFSARLKFASRVKSFENNDMAYVKVSPDGVTYTTVAEFAPADSDNQWHLHDIDLSAFTMSTKFRIVFEGAMGRKDKDKWFLDNIEIEGRP